MIINIIVIYQMKLIFSTSRTKPFVAYTLFARVTHACNNNNDGGDDDDDDDNHNHHKFNRVFLSVERRERERNWKFQQAFGLNEKKRRKSQQSQISRKRFGTHTHTHTNL